MNTYKITNLTNLAGKRDVKFNSVLDIDYIDSRVKKTIKLRPGDTVFLQIASLPISIHRLMVKKLISVIEIGECELRNNMNALKPKKTEIIDKKVNIAPKKKIEVKKGHGEDE
jgi:hypothetical protein